VIPLPAVYRNILVKMKIPPVIIEHIMQRRDPVILAKNL
jgi:hypothetical protein